jgi:hypothetical protein
MLPPAQSKYTEVEGDQPSDFDLLLTSTLTAGRGMLTTTFAMKD